MPFQRLAGLNKILDQRAADRQPELLPRFRRLAIDGLFYLIMLIGSDGQEQKVRVIVCGYMLHQEKAAAPGANCFPDHLDRYLLQPLQVNHAADVDAVLADHGGGIIVLAARKAQESNSKLLERHR